MTSPGLHVLRREAALGVQGIRDMEEGVAALEAGDALRRRSSSHAIRYRPRSTRCATHRLPLKRAPLRAVPPSLLRRSWETAAALPCCSGQGRAATAT